MTIHRQGKKEKRLGGQGVMPTVSGHHQMLRSQKLGALMLATAWGLHFGGVAYGADLTIDKNQLNNSELDMEEISVTATKQERPSFRLPASVSVIGEAEIKDLIAQSAAELFRGIPGLDFSGGPRRTGQTPSLRGQSGPGVLVLFDGVRQNFLSAHDGRFFIDPSLVKAAEVVRGPASSLYGTGAMGGVLAFRTLTAEDVLTEDHQFAYQLRSGFQGVNDEWLGGLNVFARSKDQKLDLVASLTYRDGGDISLADGSDLQADDEIASSLVKLSYLVNKDLTLNATWIGYNGSSLEPNNGQGLNVGDLMAKDIHSDTLRFGLNYSPDHAWVDVSLLAYHTKSNVREQDQDTDRVIDRRVKTSGLSISNRARYETESLQISWLTGAEYFEDRQTGTDTDTTSGLRGGVPTAKAKTLGLYSQLEVDLSTNIGQFLIIPSVRYDDFKNISDTNGLSISDDHFSPRVGVSYEPTDWLMFFGSYGQAFRAPSFNEIFADGVHFQIPLGPNVTAPNVFVPNQALKPEQSETVELGMGVHFTDLISAGDDLTLKGNWYKSTVTDLIDLGVDFAFSMGCFVPNLGPCNAGTSFYENQAKAKLEGVEIEAQYDSDYLFARLSFSHITGRNQETGDYLGRLTPDRFFATAGVKIPSLDARIGARLDVATRHTQVNDTAEERAAYETVDLFAVWQPKSGIFKGFGMEVGVNNITDTVAERVFAGVPSAGRHVRAMVHWSGQF